MTSSTSFNNLSCSFPDINIPRSDIFGASSPLDFRFPHFRSSAPIYGTPGDDVISAKDRSIVFAGEGVNLIATGLGNDNYTTYLQRISSDVDQRQRIWANRSHWNLHLRRYLNPNPDPQHRDSLLCAEYRLGE